MKKIIYILFFLSCYTKNFAQIFSNSFGIKLTKKSVAYNYVDKEKDEAYLFVGNKNKVKCVHYNSDFLIIDSLSTLRPEIEFEHIAGSTLSSDFVNLYWITDNNNQVYQQQINFKTKQISLKNKYTIDFSNQKLIQTFSSNTAFYILSIVKDSSTINLYSFDSDGKQSVNKIELKEDFFDSKNQNTNLYAVLNEKINQFDSSFEIPLIDNDTPNTLSVTSKKRKSYFDGKEVYLTIDNNVRYTQLIKINLSDTSFTIKKINQKVDVIDKSVITNSLLVKNVVYQIVLKNNKMVFSISDFDGNTIKEFSSDNDDKIAFSNSKIFDESVNSYSKKKIETTSQFVSKISKLNLGLTFYNYNDKNLITIGGTSEHIKKNRTDEMNQNAMFYFGMHGLLGSLIYIAFFNQMQTNYDFSRDVTFFYTYLDKNFSKQEDSISYSSIDLIKQFFTFNPSALYPTLISLKNGNYLGYYKPEAQQYTILKYDK